MAFKDARQCKAKARRTGQRCRNPAVTGYEVCRSHGAGSPHVGRPGGRPPVHGRYSTRHHQALEDKKREFMQDPRPGDLTEELALQRALLQGVLDKVTNVDEKTVRLIYGLINDIGALVERISRILNATALTQVEIQFLEARLAGLMVRYLDEPDQQRQFVRELIQVTAGSDPNAVSGSLSNESADGAPRIGR